jgi:hypothetical protein
MQAASGCTAEANCFLVFWTATQPTVHPLATATRIFVNKFQEHTARGLLTRAQALVVDNCSLRQYSYVQTDHAIQELVVAVASVARSLIAAGTVYRSPVTGVQVYPAQHSVILCGLNRHLIAFPPTRLVCLQV